MRTIDSICTRLGNFTRCYIFKLTFKTFSTEGNNVTRRNVFTARPFNFYTINNCIDLFCCITVSIRTTTDSYRVIKVSASTCTNSDSISNRLIINNLSFIIHTGHTVRCSTNCNACITGKSTRTISYTSMRCSCPFIIGQIIPC